MHYCATVLQCMSHCLVLYNLLEIKLLVPLLSKCGIQLHVIFKSLIMIVWNITLIIMIRPKFCEEECVFQVRKEFGRDNAHMSVQRVHEIPWEGHIHEKANRCFFLVNQNMDYALQNDMRHLCGNFEEDRVCTLFHMPFTVVNTKMDMYDMFPVKYKCI